MQDQEHTSAPSGGQTPAQAPERSLQHRIARELGVTGSFDAQAEIERRVTFLAEYLTRTGRKGYVLGISGGVDSLLAGHLAQQAVERVRRQGGSALFHAMRLPYGVQHDEQAAQKCLVGIGPDRTLTVDIKPACDALLAALRTSVEFRDAAHEDFVMGNIKARQRMIAQYAVAGATDSLVIGTDQAAEALMGFFTKYGDGAADVVPLLGLTKRRVRALAQALGAPEELVMKVPTADLETLTPLRPDEEAFGVSYQQIDDYLEGKPIAEAAAQVIERQWFATMHKRALPPGPDPTTSPSP
jgi:NAD+ synthase